jgi:hypothetical protein
VYFVLLVAMMNESMSQSERVQYAVRAGRGTYKPVRCNERVDRNGEARISRSI